jgi:hypothetical protein
MMTRTMNQTLDEIRRVGLTALRQKLGRAGMIRFLQQFGRGSGDYAKERRAWVDRASMQNLRKLAARAHSIRGRKQ